MPTKSLRRNPGWKLEPETIDIVAAARGVLGLTNAEVIHQWAMAWQNQQEAIRSGSDMGIPVTASGHVIANGEKPMAVRVETPYQVERRMKLEAIRAQLEGSNSPALPVSGALGEVSGVSCTETLVFPFEVVVNGEKHRVREFHGRRVLEWIGPKVNVMKKNLTPQETVIYWRQRTQ